MTTVIVCVILTVLFFAFLFIIDAIASKGMEYGGSLDGMERVRRLMSLSKEDLKKEPIYDQIYIAFLKSQRSDYEERLRPQNPENPEDLPTFKEYKVWQAERPDLKTWREYKEWKSSIEEEKTNDDGGDA